MKQTAPARAVAILTLAALWLPTQSAPVQRPAARQAPAPIGWCCFYPFVDVGMDQLPQSRASVLSVCSGGWGMGQVEGKVDFGPFDRQLEYARKNDLKLAIIQEINPVYTPGWLRDRAKAAGESCWDAQDRPGTTPCISSPLFRKEQEKLLGAFVRHVKETDTGRNVAYYHPGAEWWFPLGERYNPRDVAGFRRWLGRRYNKIGALNRTWGSAFADFGSVTAPRIDMMGGTKGQTGLALVVDTGHGGQHCSWSTPSATDPNAKPGPQTYAPAVPGRRYTLSAWVNVERVSGPGVFLECAWVGPNGGPPVAIDQGRPVRGPLGKWQQLSASFTAPPTAGRAWILLKFMGTGAAHYAGVSFCEASGGPELAPNQRVQEGSGETPAAWRFQNWTGGPHVKSAWLPSGGVSGGRCLRIEVSETGGVKPPYANATAAVHDWSTYWFEAGADYINSMSTMVKKLDPTRPRVTYLTMSWAAPSETDETQRSGVAPDVVGMRGKDIDAFGMQVCSADRDPFRVTACLDLMRKYRKPLWAVDLVDFTSGVHIGPDAMERITQATVQHGAAGIIYCAWHIPTVLDYSFHPYHTPAQQARMITGAMAGVKATEGMAIAPHGALVMPMLPATPGDPDGVRNDWRSFAGWYKILERLNLTVDLVTPRELESGAALGRYPWVLVPDCPDIADSALATLERYAAAGGRVVSGGRLALRDEHGLARRAGLRPSWSALPDLGRAFAGDPVRETHAGNTPPLFLWQVETPAADRALAQARKLVLPRLRIPADAARVVSAPAELRAVQWSGGGRRALYLVNSGGSPAGNVTVRLPGSAGSAPRVLVDMLPARGTVVGRSGGSITVRVPAFRASCLVETGDRRTGR